MDASVIASKFECSRSNLPPLPVLCVFLSRSLAPSFDLSNALLRMLFVRVCVCVFVCYLPLQIASSATTPDIHSIKGAPAASVRYRTNYVTDRVVAAVGCSGCCLIRCSSPSGRFVCCGERDGLEARVLRIFSRVAACSVTASVWGMW